MPFLVVIPGQTFRPAGVGALDPLLLRGWEKNLAWGKRELERLPKGKKAKV